RQLVRRLYRRPPGRGLGRQRPERADRSVRLDRWHAGLVQRLQAFAKRTAGGQRRRPRLAVGGRVARHRRRLRRGAAVRLRGGFRAGVPVVPAAGAGLPGGGAPQLARLVRLRPRRRRARGGTATEPATGGGPVTPRLAALSLAVVVADRNGDG